MKGSTPTYTFYLIAAICIAVKLWLLTAHDLAASYSPQDDFLFIKQANALVGGEWLGEYNQVTLSKGAFYPMFIALCYWLGIPLMTGQQLLWGLGCLVFVMAVYPLIKRTSFAVVIFVFLLMIPTTYFYLATGRIFRLNIYGSLVLLTFAFFLGMVIRDRSRWSVRLLWALGAGCSLAALWNTREESIFLVPSLLLIFVYHLVLWWTARRTPLSLLQLLSLYLVPLVVFTGFSLFISYQNHKHYGIFARLELNTPEFKSAYGSLQRIETDQWKQYYPVVEDARRMAYKVSPSFKELEHHLEYGRAAGWKVAGGDLHAAFFIWALRDAAVASGYYTDSEKTLDFYRRIGSEIDAACEDGRLQCREKSGLFMPPWHEEYNKSVLPVWRDIILKVIGFDNLSPRTDGLLSNGPAEIMPLYETITRERLLPSKKEVIAAIPHYHRHLNNEKIRILEDSSFFYRDVVTPLVVISLVWLMFSFGLSIWRRSMLTWPFVFALASAGSLLSHTFIMTLLTITSYRTIDRVLQVAYPLALLFVVFSFIDCYQVITRERERSDHGWQGEI